MIHRALFGSFERFIGILLEHYAGELPFWLAPLQASALPITGPSSSTTARAVAADPERRGPARARSTTAPSRRAQDPRRRAGRRCPYMLVVGDREAEEGTVSVRRHGEGDEGSVALAELVERLQARVSARD